STNYEIQRGGSGGRMGGGLGGGGGLLGMLLPLVASRFGIGGMVVAVIAVALFNGGGGLLTGGGTAPEPAQQAAPGELTDLQRLSLRVLGSTERVWTEVFAEHGQTYKPTVLYFYYSTGTSQ